jgi:hypothetical protein
VAPPSQHAHRGAAVALIVRVREFYRIARMRWEFVRFAGESGGFFACSARVDRLFAYGGGLSLIWVFGLSLIWVFGLSLICYWSISVAPVRGGTYKRKQLKPQIIKRVPRTVAVVAHLESVPSRIRC